MNINKINPYILNNSLSGYSSQKVKPYILVKNPEYKLPDEVSDLYEQVEYLESTGEQYIDTGVAPDQDTRVVISGVCGPRTEGFFGSRVAKEIDCFNLYATSANTFRFAFGSQELVFSTTSNNPIEADCSRNGFIMKIEGVTYNSSVVYSEFSCPYSMYLFACNNGGTPAYGATGNRISSCIISTNNTMLRNFIPCYRKADNKPGMYDLVNDVFYTNANQSASQDFIVGNTVSKYIPQKIKINILSSSGRLPSEYQEVEYLESTGEQWIDTGYSPTVNTGIKMSFNLTSGIGSPFGAYGNFTDLRYWIRHKSLWYYMSTSTVTQSIDNNTTNDIELNYENSRKGRLNTDIFDLPNPMSYPYPMLSLYLFAFHAASATQDIAIGILYACIITEDVIEVRNFIPCYRKADNKPGLYDTVNDVFYVNANTSASQDFIVGPNIN